MLNTDVKKQINTARDILVGKIPDPKGQIDQITNALIYKFMDDQDRLAQTLPGGKASFFINNLQKYAWHKLFDSKLSNQDRANLYVEGIEELSKSKHLPELFKDIFKDAFLPFRDANTIAMFLNEINKFDYGHSEDLGNAFEYLLSIMGSQGDAGQFRTPRNIIEFIVDAVNPTKDEHILDPACGTAGFLVEAYKHIITDKKLTPNETQELAKHIHGVDIDPGMAKIARVNLYLHGFKTPLITEDDTLTNEELWGKKYDVVLANPPFMTPKGGITPHDKFSLKSNRAEVLFTDYIAEHLKLEGRAGIVVPEGIIFQSSNTYKQLRKKLVDDNYLWGVISLPAGVFNPYSGVKTSILLLDRARAKENTEIMFYKVEDDGFGLGAQRRESKKNDLPEALKIIEKWRDGKKLELEKVSYVEKERIAEDGDYNLDGGRYKNAVDYSNAKWPMVEIGDVCDIYNGSTPKRTVREYWDNGSVPWFTISDVRDQGRIISFTQQKITEKGFKESSLKLLPKNTTLLCCTASIGEYAYAQIELTTNQQFNGLVVNENFSEKLNPKFLYWCTTNLKVELERMSGKSTFGFVSVGKLKKFKIPLPPLEIQEQIVAELDGYSSIISGAKQIVDNWKPKIDIDPEWVKVKVSEITEKVTKGTTPTTNGFQYQESGVNFVKIESIDSAGYFIKDKFAYIDENCHEAQKRSQLKENDVLFSIAGALGRVALVDPSILPANTNQALAIISPKKEISPKYLEQVLRSNLIQNQISGLKVGVAQSNLSLAQISNFEIPLPSLETQSQIVEKIEAERELIESAKKLIEIYEQKTKDVVANLWE